MESSYVALRHNNNQIIIRYRYKINDTSLEIHVNGRDLALLLEVTNRRNLQELQFEFEIEIIKPDGSSEKIVVILPQEVILATPEQLRQMEATSPH